MAGYGGSFHQVKFKLTGWGLENIGSRGRTMPKIFLVNLVEQKELDMATYNITVTDPNEIQRLEAFLNELESARVNPIRNPASVSSKEELKQRINYGLQQIEHGQTVAHEDVVEYIKMLKNKRGQK